MLIYRYILKHYVRYVNWISVTCLPVLYEAFFILSWVSLRFSVASVLALMLVRLCRSCRFWNRSRAISCNEQSLVHRFFASGPDPSVNRIEWLRATLVVLTGTCCTALLCTWIRNDSEETIDYGDVQYWLSRYEDTWYQQPFDWLGSFESLKPWIRPAAAGKQRVVHLGCGTSLLAEEMHDSGEFGEIWNIDVSELCLRIMQLRNAELRPTLRWVQADLRDSKVCRHLFAADFFDCAIDKSTLDSICDGGRDEDAAQYVAEVARILKPSGVFLMFSFSPPQSRLQHLSKTFNCEVQVAEDQCFVYTCTKPAVI